jgi:hypothetical protein
MNHDIFYEPKTRTAMPLPNQSSSNHAACGWCSKCNLEHRLPAGNSHKHAVALMKELDEFKRVDFLNSEDHADPAFSTDYLFGPSRGQMFGVLECRTSEGEIVVLRAFSGKYNGIWFVDGWVPPVFDVEAYEKIMTPGDTEIKNMGQRIDDSGIRSEERRRLTQQRKQISQALMKQLHKLYKLHNFCGETSALTPFFTNFNGAPTGAGDCCAPKLLNFAACNNLRPLGISEFYWGAENRSETCSHAQYYSCCASRCQPILGFMLCGVG